MDVNSFISVFLNFAMIFFIIVFLRNLRWRKCKKSPPLYPGTLPILGHSLLLLINSRNIWNIVRKIMLHALSNGEDICTMVFGNYTIHYRANPQECYQVANACKMRHELYDFGKPWLGEGLLTCPVTKWTQNRKLLNQAFSQQILNGYLEFFNKQSRNLANLFREQTGKGPFDHIPYTENWAFINVCSTAMGFQDKKISSGIIKEYKTYLPVLLNNFMIRLKKIWLHSDYIYKWSSLKRSQDKVLANLSKLSDEIILQKKIEMQNKIKDIRYTDRPKFISYLDVLLELNLKNIFTNEQVKNEADTIIAGGYDTSSIALAQILIVLGSHPDVQEKVYLELQAVFDGEDRDVKKQDLSQMKYLEAVIKESLRLYPVVPLVLRHIDKDIRLRNYTLPAGDDFVISIYAINRHPIWGPDAEVFRPERWLEPCSLPEKPYAYASFSIGRRNCIGIKYAMMTLKTALAHIFRSNKITADIKKVNYELLVTLLPISGHYISVEKR